MIMTVVTNVQMGRPLDIRWIFDGFESRTGLTGAMNT